MHVVTGNGVDYTSTPIIATFAAGATNTTINIPVTSDTITEESETFGLSFTIPSSLSHQVIPGNITAATGNITDESKIPDVIIIIQMLFCCMLSYYCGVQSINIQYHFSYCIVLWNLIFGGF